MGYYLSHRSPHRLVGSFDASPMISCAPRRYYMHYTVAREESVPRAASSPRALGDLVWRPGTATARHIMRIPFRARR